MLCNRYRKKNSRWVYWGCKTHWRLASLIQLIYQRPNRMVLYLYSLFCVCYAQLGAGRVILVVPCLSAEDRTRQALSLQPLLHRGLGWLSLENPSMLYFYMLCWPSSAFLEFVKLVILTLLLLLYTLIGDKVQLRNFSSVSILGNSNWIPSYRII